MKSGNKIKGPAIHANYTYKTKHDFMRWWRKQDALKKQAKEARIIQADRAISQALMVWSDDGGAES